MAHSNRRADSGDTDSSPHRSLFFHHARPALVCVGVAVRPAARDPPQRLWAQRGGLAMRLARGWDSSPAAFATAAARDRPAAGNRTDAVGGGCGRNSFVCAPAHRELALLVAVVRRAGRMGRRAGTAAALDSLVLSRLDAALGEPAWRMDFRDRKSTR